MRADALPLVLIRRFLGVVFIAYGSVKLLGGQFVYDEWTMTRSTVGGPFLVWAFYGYSPIYARFIGLCELIPGILLLIPRTAFLGAAALFPVALNITVMDFTYRFPGVKYLATFYTLLLGVLLAAEREKLLLFLAPIARVRAAWQLVPTIAVPASPPPRRAVRIGVAVVSTLFILWVANMIVEGSTEGPEPQAIAAASAPGKPAHVLVRSRLTGQTGIGRTATVDLRAAGDSIPSTRVFLTRLVGFVPWRVDSVVQLAEAAR